VRRGQVEVKVEIQVETEAKVQVEASVKNDARYDDCQDVRTCRRSSVSLDPVVEPARRVAARTRREARGRVSPYLVPLGMVMNGKVLLPSM
jgi:hypothetical protein